VTRLYQVFLHRDSRPDEQRYWVSRFRQTGSADRIGFVREFCQANNIVYLASTPTASRVAFRPTGAPTAITEALAAKAALLGDMIRNELGGTRFGQELMLRAAVLNSASRQYRDTLNSPRSTPQQVAIAAGNVGRALQDLEVVFRSVPGASALLTARTCCGKSGNWWPRQAPRPESCCPHRWPGPRSKAKRNSCWASSGSSRPCYSRTNSKDPSTRIAHHAAKSRIGGAWVSDFVYPAPRRWDPALIPRPEQEIFSTPPPFFLGAGARLDYCLFTKTGRKPSSW
jgi:hypothetical protein